MKQDHTSLISNLVKQTNHSPADIRVGQVSTIYGPWAACGPRELSQL